jgi:outer membrane protein assembly factor BamE
MPTLAPYKMEVQQGNIVTQEMVSKLRPGMTRSQVRFILGTPMVVDPFRADRWDYVYTLEKGGALKEQRRIAVFFQDDKLVRIDGDVVPAARDGAAAADKPKPAAPVPQKTKPAAAARPQPQPEGARLETGGGEPVTGSAAGGAQRPPEDRAVEEAKKDPQPSEKRGFFGRMLERIGF